MRKYIKEKKSDINLSEISADELIQRAFKTNRLISGKAVKATLLIFALALFVGTVVVKNTCSDFSPEEPTIITLADTPSAAVSSQKNLISIPSGTVKANPFLPYRDIGGSSVSDVPKYDLVEPPEVVNENSDAARVMDTIVSGILYDKYSPSAILNIEGNDYLVKKGDTVNNYKVLNILQDSVTVKLGNNTYKAGIGEILTEGSVNHNDVSNLSKKFGGERR